MLLFLSFLHRLPHYANLLLFPFIYGLPYSDYASDLADSCFHTNHNSGFVYHPLRPHRLLDHAPLYAAENRAFHSLALAEESLRLTDYTTTLTDCGAGICSLTSYTTWVDIPHRHRHSRHAHVHDPFPYLLRRVHVVVISTDNGVGRLPLVGAGMRLAVLHVLHVLHRDCRSRRESVRAAVDPYELAVVCVKSGAWVGQLRLVFSRRLAVHRASLRLRAQHRRPLRT
jgi:hypothetical protein